MLIKKKKLQYLKYICATISTVLAVFLEKNESVERIPHSLGTSVSPTILIINRK